MPNKPMKYKLKRDRYAKARGGSSRFLDIGCSACGGHIVLYQKDGPGDLLRMYLDRIFAPYELASLQHARGVKKDLPVLRCKQCQAIIGMPMVYKPEKRLAFRMVPGSFTKRISDGTYPPSRNAVDN